MVKKKIKEKIKKGVREIRERVAELEELEEALDDEVVNEEGMDEEGIFDEDLEFAEGRDVSDFDIGETILSSAPTIETWTGQNLEEEVGRSWVEKDWGPEEEFVGGGVYNASNSGDVYGKSLNDSYGVGERGEGIYGADVYSGKKSEEGSYEATGKGKGMKIYSEEDGHRGSKSMLETGGFKDEDTQKKRDLRASDKYQSRDLIS